MMSNVAVAFLARGGEGGLAALQDFIESYKSHPSGYKHQLYILAKGWNSAIEYEQMRDEVKAAIQAQVIDLPDDGFDWGAYFRSIEIINEDYVCFLNTHSRIVHKDWLSILMHHAEKPDVGLTGCTASYRTIARTVFSILPLAKDFAIHKGLARAVWSFFKSWIGFLLLYPTHLKYPRFPNPHIRSNAFVVRRELFCEFAQNNNIPKTKQEAYMLESCSNSLTRFVECKGLLAVVVNSSGACFTKENYHDSHSFFYPDKDQYLIADNQTKFYEDADIWQRRNSEILAWGMMISKIPESKTPEGLFS